MSCQGSSNTSLQEQLKAEGADPVAIAKAAGFSITTEDLKEHGQTLSDDELEDVSGGGNCRCLDHTGEGVLPSMTLQLTCPTP